ncbi:MAG: S1C family serine protease [Acidobacteriota bacterium]
MSISPESISPAATLRRRVAWLVLLVCVAVAGPVPAQDGGLKELNRKARESVVLLRVFGPGGAEIGTGTGFFVDAATVVTNHHVVEGGLRVDAEFHDGRVVGIDGVLAGDEDADLAILRAPADTSQGLPLYAGPPIEVGEEIVVLGSPLGFAGTLSTGIVSGRRDRGVEAEMRTGSGSPRLQIDAAISPGSSGSPVMNLRGEVVGVAVSVMVGGQNLNFAVPVEEVERLRTTVNDTTVVRHYGQKGEMLTPGRTAVLRNLAVSVVFFVLLFVALRRLR